MDNKLNTGAIFKNKNKVEGDNKPDYKGTIDVDGQAKEIALWLREAKSGIKYFSVKVGEPYQAQQPEQLTATEQQKPEPPLAQEFINDLPF